MMFLELDHVFAPPYFFLYFYERWSKKFHFLHISLDILVGLTPLHLNTKYKKRTDIFWAKTLMFSTKLN